MVCLTYGAKGQEQQYGEVTYVTSTMAYVNLGTRNGFTEGDTIRILEPGGNIAGILIVRHVSSKSLAADIVSKDRKLVRGDRASGIGSKIVVPPRPILVIDSTKLAAPDVETVNTAKLVTVPVSDEDENEVTGRLSLQYYALENSSTKGMDFSQPAAVIHLGVEHIDGGPLSFSMYTNHRYDARTEDVRRGVTDNRLRNRIYEFALRYGDHDDAFRATLGRFIIPAIGGVGTVDGAMLIQRFASFEAGIAAGSQPDYKNSDISTDDPKFAAYVRYSNNDVDGLRYQSALGYAQTYRSSNLDRGFMYFQNTLSIGNSFSVYHNMNFDMYDLVDARGASSPHLTDFFVSGTYRPVRKLAVTGSYALRRNVYLMESYKGLSSSYFDKAFYQNYQLGVGYNIGSGMFANITGSIRTKEGDEQNATAFNGRYTFSNLFDSKVNVYFLGSWAENRYNRSTNAGIELNRDLMQDLYTSIRVQQSNYQYLITDRKIKRLSVVLDTYYRIARSINYSISYEHSFEDAYDNDRLYTQLTWRFR
jgi:hypothetical protein